MKKLILLIAFTSFVILTNAQCNIDQSQLLWNGGTSERNLPGYYEGQTFTAGSTGVLCEVDMLMFNTMTGTGTLKIYAGNGITGLLLITQTVTVVVPTMTSVWQNWTITSPPSVISGSSYTFQFIPIQGGGLPDPYGIDVQTSDVYAGGYCITSPTWDLPFRTYIDMTTGINNINTENNFVIYPNPAIDNITIETQQPSTIEISDITGQQIITLKADSNKTNIDVSALPCGVYVAQVKTEKGVVVRKFIKE